MKFGMKIYFIKKKKHDKYWGASHLSVFGHFEGLAFKGLKIKETKRLGIIVTPIQIWRTNLFFDNLLLLHVWKRENNVDVSFYLNPHHKPYNTCKTKKKNVFFLALVNVRFRNLIKFFPSVKVDKPLFMNNISHKLVAIKTTQ